MRKGRDGEKKTGGKKKKTDDYSGHYVIASSRLPKRRPLECHTIVQKLRDIQQEREGAENKFASNDSDTISNTLWNIELFSVF